MRALVPYLAAAVIAGASFFTGAVTDVGTAVKLAFDKEALKVECANLIEGE
jgi:hypothetical protein